MNLNYIDIIEVVIFYLIILVGGFYLRKYLVNYSMKKDVTFSSVLPIEEVSTLKQLLYLILASLALVDFLYMGFLITDKQAPMFYLYDIIISLICIIALRDEDKFISKRTLLKIFALPIISTIALPIISTTPIIVVENNYFYLMVFEIIHLIAIAIIFYLFMQRFIEYSKHNKLSYTILLLFMILIISLFVTIYSEKENALNALVMISSAFTSNGYTVLGNTTISKIDNLFLVWGGYILSGVGTATLTSAILVSYFDKRLKRIEELIKEKK